MISEDKKIYQIVETYEEDQNLMNFKLKIIHLIKETESDNEFDDKMPENDPEDDEEEEENQENNHLQIQGLNNGSGYEDPANFDLSSPLGNALFARKKQKKDGLKKIRDVLKPLGNKEKSNGI